MTGRPVGHNCTEPDQGAPRADAGTEPGRSVPAAYPFDDAAPAGEASRSGEPPPPAEAKPVRKTRGAGRSGQPVAAGGPRIRADAVPPSSATLRRVTMTDVARVAGVSQSSVSLVLNQMTGARISDATRRRVIEVAKEIGYELPAARRSLEAAVERNTIAYLVDEISTSPHPVVNLDGARDIAWESGFLVEAHVTRSNADLESATIEALKRDLTVLGVIYSTIFTRKVTLPKGLEDMPVVLLNCYTDERRHLSILPGEVGGGFAATSYLLRLGHRRIALINGEPWMDASQERQKGYRQALATADIAFETALVRNGDWLPLKGYQHTIDLLRLADPPSAILCANDLMAIGALEAAAELRLRVPDDLSIMGYDDQELARYTHPPLTTLLLPNYEMGRKAAEALIDVAARGKPLRPMAIKIDGPVVERASAAPPSRRAADLARSALARR
jgi:LacI family transcriptional regulator